MNEISNHTFYINLDERKEKNSECLKQLNLFGIQKPNRFNAIKDEIPLIGCAKSHIECLKKAKTNDLSYILIFEDDIVFIDHCKCRNLLLKYLDYDYDVLFLSTLITNDYDYNIINDDLIKVINSTCTHGYIVKNHYYDKLIKIYEESIILKKEYPDNELFNLDVFSNRLKKKDNWYCLKPILCTQKDGYSDNFLIQSFLERNILTLPLKRDQLPDISILTPTYNRREFLRLMILNIKNFDYPKDKITWIILDSYSINGAMSEKLIIDEDERYNIEKDLGIKELKYKYVSEKLSIGEKRNRLCDMATTEYLINMDDDDIYLPMYLYHSVNILKNFNKDIVGCLDMVLIYPYKNYEIYGIQCKKTCSNIDESTICMRRSYWEKHKYDNVSQSESKGLIDDDGVWLETNILQCVICTCWEQNTVGKNRYRKDFNKIKVDFSGGQYDLLKEIFEDKKSKLNMKAIFPINNQVNQTNYYWFKKGFNENEINKIKDYVEPLEFQKGTTFSGINRSVRDSKIKWIEYNPETEWLYEKIYNYAKEANDILYKFKLYYSKDSIQYSRYSVNGKYDWHIDIGEGTNSLRKLSCSILLNDPSDFEGGDFEYWIKSKPDKVPLEKGSVLFFPSFFLHRVKEIFKGERESLVLWIGGDSYQ